MKPVLYLDVDDTLLSLHESFIPPGASPILMRTHGYAAPGAREFMQWALENFEVRWLTWWCPGGDMLPERAAVLESELGLEPGSLAGVAGACFLGGDARQHKTDGIAWAEHEAGRPFVWVEDWISERERQVLRGRHALHCWIPCNVTLDPGSLRRAHATLQAMLPTMHVGRAA